jgi:hypothetical protein
MTATRLVTGILIGILNAGVLSPPFVAAQASSPDRPAESPFGWVGDLDAARESSLRTGKPILLLIDSPEQRWDRYIESAVLPDSALAQVVRRLVWVLPDLERGQELRARFHVVGLPTLLLLGPGEENIHRTAGYLAPKALSDFLREGLRHYELFARGLDWDVRALRSDRLSPKYEFDTLPAPSSDCPQGIAFIGGALFVQQGQTVFKLDETTGETLESLDSPWTVVDLASDDRLLYAIDYCWTSGQPIYVIDPADGEIVRTIVTQANSTSRVCAASGVEAHAGRLWVLELTGRIHEVEPGSGNIVRTIETERDLRGLAYDGEHLVSLSSKGVVFLDPASGHLDRMVPMNYPLRSIGFHGRRFFLMEQPVEGFDRNHDPIRISPRAFVLYAGSL